MEAIRLRLLFKDHHILSKSQRKEGLQQSWILLKSRHQTISDFASYILDAFHLHDACPHGLLLSMDGFVLPPFELTCVLKDRDIISVRKKGESLSGIIKLGDDVNLLEGEGILENRHVVTGVKLLANEEFNKENGGYGIEQEENESEQLEEEVLVESTPKRSKVSKKRKASEKLSSSKKKKSKVAKPETSPAANAVAQDDVHQDRKRSSRRRHVHSKKKDIQEDKSDDRQRETEKSSSPDVNKKTDDNCKDLPDSERLCQLEEEDEGNEDVTQTPSGAKKLPSRSARRKKAKRQWLREQVRKEKELQQKQLLETGNQQLPSKDSFKVSEGHEQPVQNGEDCAVNDNDSDAEAVEDNIVPIVIRPGHIRFEPLDKENQAVRRTQFSVENYQWNSIKSKKKGQKWGKESPERTTYKKFSQACSEEPSIEEEMPVNNQMELDKLMPYSTFPKEGDIVAYRLIELSSSWTPELSSFRVGNISNYDSASNRIVLETVPEYPLTNQEKVDEEASGPQPDTLYREDGSLEIDYSSLVDVRLVKHGPYSEKSAAGRTNEATVHDKDATISTRPNDSIEATPAPTKENGAVNAWEEIAQALNAKKTLLLAEDEWNSSKSSGKNPWSYGALRRNALGPTIAILRAQNEI